MASGPSADVLAGLKIIDADSHWTEAPDLWTSQVPSHLASQVPVQRTIDGVTSWYVNDELWASTGGNTIRSDGTKVLGSAMIQPFSEIDSSASVVKDRLQLMDQIGLFAQVLYPNAIGFASNHIFAIEDDAQRQLVLQVYNDHLVEVQQESGGRLIPQAMLPVWDMDLTINEMTRLIDLGIRGFTLSGNPELLGLPELPEPYFDPMWDLFNESGAVPNFHIASGRSRQEMEDSRAKTSIEMKEAEDRGASGSAENRAPSASEVPLVVGPSWRMLGPQRRQTVQGIQGFLSNARIVLNLCTSDLFDRYPNLKIVSVESGIGWVPFLVEAMEHQFAESVTHPQELALAKRHPVEYLRDHIYVMFWFESTAAIKRLDDVGVRNVMVETDIPHPTCLFPNTSEYFASVLADIPRQQARRILQDNAAELYRIDV